MLELQAYDKLKKVFSDEQARTIIEILDTELVTKADVKEIKLEMKSLKNQMTLLEKQMALLEKRMESLEEEVKSLKESLKAEIDKIFKWLMPIIGVSSIIAGLLTTFVIHYLH